MKVSDFTQLLEYPGRLNSPILTHQLEEVLDAYPWFQAARALHLKGLKNLNSYKYNQALKVAAAFTTDREVLFDFITSDVFNQNAIADAISGKASILEFEVITEEVVPGSDYKINILESEEDGPLPRSSKDAEDILDPGLFTSANPEIAKKLEEVNAKEQAKAALGLGKPLEFKKGERHSFSQWLQLTRLHDDPDDKVKKQAGEPERDEEEFLPRERKFELIDRFISVNPKIVPNKDNGENLIPSKETARLDKTELMTETLARIYLEQGKYKEALQAYKILILKYPEKSSFFADQIKAVEKLRNVK